ncbi:MAG: DegV family protein [Erysipelotrichia bacterium]|nr:DegV family protein [Erysipelotrichia bacterium]
MNKQKIAIMSDSCCDIPKEYVEKYGMYILPLKVIYKDREYLDGVDISAQQVYESLSQEIPSTSLPSGQLVLDLFAQIKADGYEKVIVITLSSGLSGTNNMIHLIAEEVKGLEIAIIDTKNIAVAAGFHAIQAGRYIEKGYDFSNIITKIENNITRSKVFFVVETLEYLQKGGRIGLVASLVGNALNLKPIISCNEEGIYYTVAKVRGRKRSISKTIELALKEMNKGEQYLLAICNGAATQEAELVKQEVLPQAKGLKAFIEGQISPVLGVHTGPGLIGIGVMQIDE